MITHVDFKFYPFIPFIFIFILSFIGGFADAASFLTFGVFVGHLTGNTVLGLVFVVQEKYLMLLSVVMALGGFVTGTVVGIIWRRHIVDKSKMYVPLIIEAILILVIALLLKLVSNICIINYLLVIGLSSTLGLQNGIYTKFKTAGGIHTTYISGGTTSLLEAMLYIDSSDQSAVLKLKILFVSIIAFILGAFIGALVTYYFGSSVFIMLVLLLFTAAVFCKRNWNNIYL